MNRYFIIAVDKFYINGHGSLSRGGWVAQQIVTQMPHIQAIEQNI